MLALGDSILLPPSLFCSIFGINDAIKLNLLFNSFIILDAKSQFMSVARGAVRSAG